MDSSQAPAAASLLARAASLAPYTLSTSNIDTTQPTVSDAWLSYEFDRTSLESRWVRLHRHEERRLDSAVSAGGAIKEPVVPLSGGRAEARLCPSRGGHDAQVGEIYQRYIDTPPTALARACWCYKPRNGKWTPFPPHDDAALELLLRRLARPTTEARGATEGGSSTPVGSEPIDATSGDPAVSTLAGSVSGAVDLDVARASDSGPALASTRPDDRDGPARSAASLGRPLPPTRRARLITPAA